MTAADKAATVALSMALGLVILGALFAAVWLILVLG